MKPQKKPAEHAVAKAGPFDAVLAVFGRRGSGDDRKTVEVEKRLADVGMLDELASLDMALANRQFERLNTAYENGMQPAAADVSLYTAAASSVRASVSEKARLLGTYGAAAGRQDRDAAPTFQIVVNRGGGKLPPETGAEDADDEIPAVAVDVTTGAG
jgi:hypothetical protein